MRFSFWPLLALACYAGAEDNGVAFTPPMGYNFWNCYADKGDGVTESIVLGTARTMASKLAPSGYEYVNLDCGWSTKHRDPATGLLQVNRTRFPHGMAWLGEHIHRLGLKFGTYGALGYAQCCSGHADPNATDGSGPGCNKDRDHQVCRNETFFDRDAELWAGEWGVDYVKFDGCGGSFDSVRAMRDALNRTGRRIVYSVHSSVEPGAGMDPSLANLWRTGPDIGPSYEQVLDRAMIANNVSGYLAVGPGGFGDPDMLQVGNIGVSSDPGAPPSLFPGAEGRTQMALWCLLKAPLLIGTFLNNMTDATLATLTNAAAIAVNQDPLGEAGALRADGGWVPDKPRPTTNPAFGYQVWSGALSAGGAAAVLANLEPSRAQNITLSATHLPRSRGAPARWDLTEAFSGERRVGVTLPATATVAPHDVAMWVLTPHA